jgi:hypothetical protein
MEASMASGLGGSSPKRPLEVWLLTAYAFLFPGLQGLVLTVAFLVSPPAGQPRVGPLDLIIPLIISAGVVVSAIATFLGRPTARWILVGFVILNYGLIAVNNIRILQTPGLSAESDLSAVRGRVIRGFVMPTIYFSYFFSRRRDRFFAKRKREADSPYRSPDLPAA